MITIRKANNSDIASISTLLDQLWYKQPIEELSKIFELYTNSDKYGLIVADENNNVIGFIAYSLTHIFVDGKIRIHVEGLIVDEKFRRHGIGKLLIKSVEDIAQNYAPCVIDLVSRVTRAKLGSHDFYKSLNYGCEGEQAKIYFRKKIEN